MQINSVLKDRIFGVACNQIRNVEFLNKFLSDQIMFIKFNTFGFFISKIQCYGVNQISYGNHVNPVTCISDEQIV